MEKVIQQILEWLKRIQADIDRLKTQEFGPSATGSAPDNASYVTINNEAGLTSERALAVGADLVKTDGGAGASVTLARAGNKILLFDSGGTVLAEFAATQAGLIAALAAATSGDIVECPNAITIALTTAITIPSGATLRDANLSISGFAGNAITLSLNSILDQLAVSHDGTGYASAVTVYAVGMQSATIKNSLIITQNATVNTCVQLGGDSLFKGPLVDHCYLSARNGTTNRALILGDFSFAEYCTIGAQDASAANVALYFIGTLTNYETPIAVHCWCNGYGTNGYGVQVAANKTGRATHTYFYGTTIGARIESGATLSVYANEWTSLSNAGSLIHLTGDLSSASGLGWYSVKDYGAVGDGIANDTTAVQAAIDAAHAAGGGIVWFNTGTYLCDPLTIYLDTLLMGVNKYWSLLKANSAGSLLTLTNSQPNEAPCIQNLGLEGNGVGTVGLDVIGGLFFNWHDFYIHDFTSYGIYLRGSLIGELSNFLIWACPIGIKIESYTFGGGIGYYQGNAIRLDGKAVIDECSSWAMHITGSSQIVIDGGDFERNGTLADATTGTIYYESPSVGDNLGLKIINAWFENTKGKAGVVIDTPPAVYAPNIYNVIEDTLFSANIPNATYGVYVNGTVRANKLICKRVEFYSNAATADFYADGANATIYQELCVGTTGGAGTFVNMLGGGGTVTGTGTNGKLAKWTGASSIGDATNTDADVASAVSLKHTQGSDTALGVLGTKNPPIDADKFVYRDSTSGDALVTVTGTQLKAYLKTYFDTQYVSGGGVIWSPLTNGDPASPALVFDPANGDVIMVAT